MFKKIDITKFGSFNNFTWDSSVEEFKKVNLFYGRNYSGKTTLSRIFRCLDEKALHTNFADAQFSLSYQPDASPIETICEQNLLSNSVSNRVFVYNQDFIKDNLSFLHDDKGNIVPFTIAGYVNQDIIKKIERYEGKKDGAVVQAGLIDRLSGRVQRRTEKHISKNLSWNEKKSALDKFLTNSASSVKANPNFLPQSEVAGYNRNRLKNEIDALKDSFSTRLTEEQKKQNAKTIQENAKDEISPKNETKPKFETRLTQTKTLLAKSITVSQPIEELLHNRDLEKWVGSGIDLHRDKLDSCAFCNSQLSIDDWQRRWNQLDEHFSQESKKLEAEITTEIERCNQSKLGISNYLMLEAHIFYAEFSELITDLGQRWDTLKQTYMSNLDTLISALETKLTVIRKNEDLSYLLNTLQDNSDEILLLITEFNQIVEKNNAKTRELTKCQNEAKKVLRDEHIKKIAQEFKYFEEEKEIIDLKSKTEQLERLKIEANCLFTKHQEAAKQLRTQLSDEGAAAASINQFLQQFFAHPELSIEAVTSHGSVVESAFQVLRNGQLAKNLSEGECSLVAFCYFVAKVKDQLGTSQKPIIFIDDPMSSLDGNHIFFVFSLIDAVLLKEEPHFEQIFMSTHNLEFFKYLKKLHVIDTKEKEKKNLSAYLIERQGNSTIIIMPDYMRTYVTEFQYLFKKIYDAAELSPTQINETHYSIGNEMRKFLEVYLYFKFPHLSSKKRLDEFFNVGDGTRT